MSALWFNTTTNAFVPGSPRWVLLHDEPGTVNPETGLKSIGGNAVCEGFVTITAPTTYEIRGLRGTGDGSGAGQCQPPALPDRRHPPAGDHVAEGGRLMTGTAASLNRVDGAWVQSGTLDFLRSLTGANRAWEVVTEVPALTIPRAGVWEVAYQVRGVSLLPAPGAANTDTGVTAGMYKNGALVPGTEAIVIYHNEAAGDQGKQIQATGSRQFIHTFAAGDAVQLGAYRLGTSGTAAVVSNGDGRTSITAHWVAPEEGDTPA
ncbi:hypothetical protein ABT300_08985 [Streptomyces sp. NPDC001027]|uniref:hypothetical protein n=1 Tax=Streptomyces sp. NPDC001027 TaxID=3154771 RepID=UPI00332AE3A6